MAMDGVLPDGTDVRVRYDLMDQQMEINSIMQMMDRQNLLVPSRAHPSFPLAELLDPRVPPAVGLPAACGQCRRSGGASNFRA